MIASIFTDCFPCTGGPINGGSPGPTCGWTFSEAFGPKGGQVTFTPGVMSLDALGGISDTPGASHPLAGALSSGLDITVQFKLTEHPGSVGSGTDYQLYFFDSTFTTWVLLFLNATGFAQIISGSTVSGDGYSGTWVPTGGSHKVDFSINALGIPTLFIDDIPIPLIFSGSGFSPFGIFVADTLYFFSLRPSAVTSAKVMDVFLTSGIQPPTTVYCCQ